MLWGTKRRFAGFACRPHNTTPLYMCTPVTIPSNFNYICYAAGDGRCCKPRVIQIFDCRQRPYRVECTGSLPNSEVKRRRARLVLGWGTAREDLRVLLAFCKTSFICLSLFFH